ncbi:phosphodiester glycosidase family protein [Fluviispira multicolorata]|uniref:Phosphodiester glycosidase domain-containing protein n=1 Tax=Fluviispira multicolorata TaxID=2654512 RepID=A0A833JDW0_9BACT|nr:phosphodiester glycosidase family protein [Fluviispira multicolorata]KAB8029186.1 hypothetical protein GCL57_11660 [Fluviispira multicolorata]
MDNKFKNLNNILCLVFLICFFSIINISCSKNNTNNSPDEFNNSSTESQNGIQIKSEIINRDGNNLEIWSAEVEPSKRSISLVRASNQLTGSETVSEVAIREKAIFAMNGGFFKIFNEKSLQLSNKYLDSFHLGTHYSPYYALPRYSLKIENNWYGVNSVFHDVVGWNSNINEMNFGKISVVPALSFFNLDKSKSDQLNLTAVNSLSFKNATIVYTKNWKKSIQFPNIGYLLKYDFEQNKIVETFDLSKILNQKDRNMNVNDKVILIYFYSFNKKILFQNIQDLFLDFEVQTLFEQDNIDWKNMDFIVSGRPQLIRNGRILTPFPNSNFHLNKFPRTAMCKLNNGNVLFLTLGDAELMDNIKDGASILTWAKILLEKGCKDAINLDGGGSATFYYDNKLRNKQDPLQERHVSDVIIVK